MRRRMNEGVGEEEWEDATRGIERGNENRGRDRERGGRERERERETEDARGISRVRRVHAYKGPLVN